MQPEREYDYVGKIRPGIGRSYLVVVFENPHVDIEQGHIEAVSDLRTAKRVLRGALRDQRGHFSRWEESGEFLMAVGWWE